MYKVDNAIIMAAGMSSRFAPLSYERPKALTEVKGEILIERQICQLLEAGIEEIVLVVGYKKEQFFYLKDKYSIIILENDDYLSRNNNGSIFFAKEYISNSYICSADNYFSVNPFEKEVEESYYSAVYSRENTKEWCMKCDSEGWIREVVIGGEKSWYMLGHAFWSTAFSCKFLEILEKIYEMPETRGKLWESIYMENIEELSMKIKKYNEKQVYEFDTLEELRNFDVSYRTDSRSEIMNDISRKLRCNEGEIEKIYPLEDEKGFIVGISFCVNSVSYLYNYEVRKIERE